MAPLLAARWLQVAVQKRSVQRQLVAQRTLLQTLARVPSLVRQAYAAPRLVFLLLVWQLSWLIRSCAPLFKNALVHLAPGLLVLGTDKLERERARPRSSWLPYRRPISLAIFFFSFHGNVDKGRKQVF